MSKNFELLQQIGDDEALFRTASEAEEAAPGEQFEPGAALDQETFERLMEKASSIGLFQDSSEPLPQTFLELSECNLDGDMKTDLLEAPGGSNTFRIPRHLLDRIGDPEIFFESRVRESAAEGPSLAKPFSTEAKPKNIPGTATQESFPSRKVQVEQRPRQKRSLPSSWLDSVESAAEAPSLPKPFSTEAKPKNIPGTAAEESFPSRKVQVEQRSRQKWSLPSLWLDSIKSAAKRWESQARAEGPHAGADAAAIAREEEIKLAQRVFPGKSQDSPRVALFAALEGEVACGPTCARVAELLAARTEGPVCIVDANFPAPSLHEYFGVDNLKGLAEAAVESGPIQNFAQQISEPNLWLIPSGKAAVHLRFPAMADGLRVRIEELRKTFKYVVIHSGRLRMETSAIQLSLWTDGVVLLVEANATRRETARRLKDMLDAANVKVLGVVLNNRTYPIPEAIYRRF